MRFFDGQVRVDQPKAGYRAGTDAILLAASLDAKPGSRVLELGCGSGAVLLLAANHHGDCQFVGLEKSQDMLALARKNTARHAQTEIVEGSMRKLPTDWHLQFDHVLANPPYFDDRKAVRMSKAKESAFVNKKSLTIDDWLAAMLLALKPRGFGTLIYRADGLEKLLAGLHTKVGGIRILPIHSFRDEPAKRVIIRFRKGVKSESVLLPALIMHERGSEDKYTPLALEILKGEKKLIIS